MRKEGWEKILHDHLATTKPFVWGENDCALWCADWVLKATGEDFSVDWRGKYFSEETLQTLMMEAGFTTAEEIADSTAFSIIPITFSQRGDVVLHPTQGCLGICNGMFSHFLTESGLTRVSTLKCKKAWRV